MYNSNIVLFDLDDVIAKMRLETKRVFEKISGKQVPIENWDVFCSNYLYGIDFCPQTMIDEKIIENSEVEDDAEEVFEKLHSIGFKTAIVTARGWHPNGVELTEKWLESKNIQPTEIHVVGLNDKYSKYNAFSKISRKHKIYSFIDDQVKYINQAIDHDDVREVAVRNHPWNQNVNSTKAVRVNTLTDFYESIIETI